MITTNHALMNLAILMIAYLLGSVPSGYLAGRWLSGIDLREKGSGSTGATNVLRHVGKWPAFVVFTLDVSKGAVAVLLAKELNLGESIEVLAGLTSLTGHIWPVWLRWKGGKAVATGFGMLLGLSWLVGLGSFAIFIVTLSVTKTVSISSMIASLSLPLLMIFSFQGGAFSIPYFTLSLASMLLVIWRHRSNLKRIIAGNEPKLGQNK